MDELFNVNQRLHNFLTKQKEAGGNTTDENRSIGTQAALNNKDVYWCGQNYGWQSQESYNKLKEGPEFRAGHINATRIGTDINQAIGMGVDALPEQVKSTALDVVRQGVQAYQGLPQGIRTGINNVGQGLSNANELVSKTTNISPIITGEALTAAGTAGVGSAIKKVATGMNVVDDLRNTVARAAQPGFDYYAVTAKNPEILALGGVKRGDDIISPEQAKHLTRRANEVTKRVDKLPLMRDKLNELIESGADKKTIERFRDTIDDTKAMLHRKRSNVSVPTKEDPLWYQTTPGKAAKKQEEIARGLKAKEYLEAHHLFPKVLSSAFYDRMDWMIHKGIAEQDDLVLMNNIAIKLGRKPGDYKSNMLNMRTNPHNELHTAMDYAKDEFNEAEWAKIVSKTKDVDDLLILWRDTIKNTVLPTAEDAISMNNLDKTIESVSPKFTGSKKPSKEIFKNLRDKQLSI